MKLAFLQTDTFPLNWGVCAGVERVELEEVARLTALGNEVTLTVPDILNSDPLVPKWLKVISRLHPDNRFLKWKYPLHFAGLNRNADIYHGHYTPYLPLIFGSKALIHFHGLAISHLPLYRFDWARKRYCSAHYVFCAKHLIEHFKAKYPEIPVSHIHVLHNGIDVHVFLPRSAPRASGPVRFSFHGRWVKHKGILSLLKALSILETYDIEFECHVAGSPAIGLASDEGHRFALGVNQLARNLRSVRLAGAIPYHSVPNFLQKVDFGVVPSIYPDPFPLAALEIMASGLPVVAYDTGGLREAIVDGKTGFLVENNRPEKLAEKILFLIKDPEIREKMGKAARDRVVNTFSWEGHISGLLNIYDQMSRVDKNNKSN